ncbi:MAG TPA: NAD(P)H-binding protein [Dermatophilaceae bacterium]|nr:NAD(P)H-binding protein [Dermatophilaceae bacterium]
MIIVSAATGQYGRLVVEHLLERVPAGELAVAVRDSAKANDLAVRGVRVRYADYDEPESLVGAFRGADRLLFISSPVVDQDRSRLIQHRNVVAAAGEAGVEMIAYTSGLSADVVEADVPILGDHHVTEQAIQQSGVPYVMLRHPLYTELFINASLRSAIETGELTSNTGGRGMNTASRADLAEAAAAILTDAEDRVNAYDFTGRLWTYPDLAAALGEVSGRPVSYREVDEDAGAIGMMGLAPFVRSGGFEVQTPDLEAVLGHPAASLHDAVAAALGS